MKNTITLFTILLAAVAAPAQADNTMPTYDVRQHCEEAAQRSTNPHRMKQLCLDNEYRLRQRLEMNNYSNRIIIPARGMPNYPVPTTNYPRRTRNY